MAGPLIFIVAIVAVAYVFQIWVRYQRRLMIHRERLAAIEKGIELPPLEQEIQRSGWNVQRLLLLAGMVWISVGIGAFPLLSRLGGQSITLPWGYAQRGAVWAQVRIPTGLGWIAVAVGGIGISRLVTFAVGGQRGDSRRS